ncbi:hypothetical protein H8959_008755 [Pygathrix nigripes]
MPSCLNLQAAEPPNQTHTPTDQTLQPAGHPRLSVTPDALSHPTSPPHVVKSQETHSQLGKQFEKLQSGGPAPNCLGTDSNLKGFSRPRQQAPAFGID